MTTQTAAKSALSQVVASNIRAEAARRGWTQVEVAKRLDWSRVAISDRYRGRTPWGLDELERVAEVLGLEVAELVARPKGFEPLTFWLGADHTITDLGGEDEEGLFCDRCGVYVSAYIPDEGAGLHAWHHHGERVERAA